MIKVASEDASLCYVNGDLVKSSHDNPLCLETLDKNGSSPLVRLENTSININQGSDIIIGPVTQFHAPVTIYQEIPTSANPLKRRTSENLKTISSSSSQDLTEIKPNAIHKKPLILQKRNIIIISGLFLLFVIIAATITAIVLTKTDKDTTFSDNTTEVDSNCDIIPHSQWGRPPKYVVKTQVPVPLVIISHSATEFCSTKDACTNRVISMQEYHVGTIDSPDIGYNFIIGGDGYIYTGRGWGVKNFHRDNSVGINFIGNYLYDELTTQMIVCAQYLLEYGVKNGQLAQDYKIVAHNQTFATQSPGTNVYKIISTWPHFFNLTI